ncbi:hypothetical protein MP228_012030 [Amoeboaphelidium protococcarum]|nr:hypothetical protein MP228_012030 [Amoeboaphelidium protococcarum]
MAIPTVTTVPRSYVAPFRVVIFVFLIAVFLVNGLTQSLRLNGTNTGEISDRNLTYFTPAGYAFSIWGLIYALLAVYGIHQLRPSTYDSAPLNFGLGVIPLLNFIFNICWIFVWQYEQTAAALVFLILILLTNSIIYIRLVRRFSPADSYLEYFVLCGWRFYFGWTLVATFVNLWVVATKAESAYINGAIAGYIMVVALSSVLSSIALDPIPVGIVGWAFVAISQKWNRDVEPAIYGASLTAGVIALIFSAIILVNVILENFYYKSREGWSKKAGALNSGESFTSVLPTDNVAAQSHQERVKVTV